MLRHLRGLRISAFDLRISGLSGRSVARLALTGCIRDTLQMQLTLAQLTDHLVDSYRHTGGINHLDGKNLPSKRAISLIVRDLLRLLFPGFFDEQLIHSSAIKTE